MSVRRVAPNLLYFRICIVLELMTLLLQNDLLLNPDKSEVIVFGTTASLRAAELTSVKVCGAELPVAQNIKSLGVVLDSRLTFDKQVQSICKSCNYHLWALRHIRHLVPQEVAHTLACSIVMSRMDYCNSLLIGAPEYVISRLQRVQNNLARIVTGSSHRTPAAPLLSTFHWLPVRHRIEYKLSLITYKVQLSYIESSLLERSSRADCQDWILAAFLYTSIVDRPSNKNGYSI